MKHFFTFLLAVSLFFSCDDGDIIVTSFDFEEIALEQCGDVGEYIFYKINNVNLETLSLRLRTQDSILSEEGNWTYTIDESNNTVNYRTFDQEVPEIYFCSFIPPTTPTIERDYFSTQGTLLVTSQITETILPDEGTEQDTTYVLSTSLDFVNLRLVSSGEGLTEESLDMGTVENTID
ncbi:MAG: hypothetical protein WD554_05110 [Flavobacteriaceae bacterium]